MKIDLFNKASDPSPPVIHHHGDIVEPTIIIPYNNQLISSSHVYHIIGCPLIGGSIDGRALYNFEGSHIDSIKIVLLIVSEEKMCLIWVPCHSTAGFWACDGGENVWIGFEFVDLNFVSQLSDADVVLIGRDWDVNGWNEAAGELGYCEREADVWTEVQNFACASCFADQSVF